MFLPLAELGGEAMWFLFLEVFCGLKSTVGVSLSPALPMPCPSSSEVNVF